MTPAVPGRIVWAVERFEARPRDRILEIGCGGGHAAALLHGRFPRAAITAIDRSALQVTRSRQALAAPIAAGRVRVERLALEDAPDHFGEGAFDRALAINVNAFWTTPAPSVSALARLLAPGGRAYLVYEPPSAARVRALRLQLTALLGAHGLPVVEAHDAPVGAARAAASAHALCLVGERPAR